jgi:peptidoglycan/LPS O-acetylase OafA/YrhL
MSDALTRPLEWAPARQAISRVPYLPGLDGMRALAVIAVMVYHANSSWLPGGFLGVEVFFVISGYLITLLLIGEHERTGQVSLRDFWMRRAKRLLPALFFLLIGMTVYTALFKRDALGQLRGDVVGGLTYVSNWYQIWVGQGYTASGDFAPLRHLWSLAVEEQFYLLWPLAMVGLMRLGRRRLPDLSRWLLLASLGVTVLLALLYHPGVVESCATTPEGFWKIGDRCLAKTDTLYLNTITRSGGLLLGAAFAMIWRPVAIMRGPMRHKGQTLDLIALAGLIGLGVLVWTLHIVTPNGADPWLFRGGFLLTGVATLAIMAAVTHRHAVTGKVLAIPVLLWIGTRSYGLYLFHWPIYQIIRNVAGNQLSLGEFALAMAITLPLTEFSYRFIETPIRTGRVGPWWAKLRARRDPTPRRLIVGAGAAAVALTLFSGAALATADLKLNEIEQSIRDNEDAQTDLEDLLGGSTTTTSTSSTVAVTSTTVGVTQPNATAPAATTTAAPTTTATTAPPSTTTVLPPGSALALGDSVMAGAIGELDERGILANAQQNRQMSTMVPTVRTLRDNGTLDSLSVFVVHLGTNGPISDETVDEFFGALADVPRVIVLTVHADRDWTASVNQKLSALPNEFPNVQVLYWDGLANDCPGDCFAPDGIHLNNPGAAYYAQLIADLIGRGG